MQYGRSPFSLNETASDGALVNRHSVALTSLLPDTTFFYLINSSNASGYQAIDDNAGFKYRVTTKAAGEGDTGSNETSLAEALTLEATLLLNTNNRFIDVIGRTSTGALVRLYVNKPASAIGGITFDASTIATSAGEFAFGRVPLSLQQNTIDLFSRLDKQNMTKQYVVQVDTEDPVVNVSLPTLSNTTSVRVQGRTSEAVAAKIVVGSAASLLNLSAGSFNLTLSLQDGVSNPVSIEFADLAGNAVAFHQDVLVSSTPPQIFFTNLPTLNPSYVQDVIIKGNVTPGSMVVVFVNNQTTPDASWSTSAAEIVKHFGQVVERGFFGLFGGEVYTARARSDGSFELPIKLSQQLDIGTEESYPAMVQASSLASPPPAQVSPATPVTAATVITKDKYRNSILVLVIGPTGLTSTARGDIVYTKCGSGGDWNIEVSDISPTVVVPEHLRRGIAQFGFNVNLDWQGPEGTGRLVGGPSFAMVPLSPEERASLAFDPSRLINPNNIIPVPSADGKKYHVLMKLNRINYTQPELKDISLKKLGIKIPILVELRYQSTYGGIKAERTQRQCIEFNSVLDIEVPASVIPKSLLEGSITAIDFVVDIINKILKPLLIITKITFFVCLLSWVVWFVYLVYQKYTCIADGSKSQSCIDAKTKANQIDYYMRWVCDRVFCPSAPSYTKFLETPHAVGVDGEGSAVDVCKDVTPGSSAFYDEKPDDLFDPKKLNCAAAYKQQWDTACVAVDELKRSRCLEAQASGNQQEIQKNCGGPLTSAFFAVSGICKGKGELSDRYRVSRGTVIYEYSKDTRTWFECKRKLEIDERTKEQRPTTVCDRELSADEIKKLGLEQQSKTKRETVINPTEGFITAASCVCLPAVNGYLQLWRNVLTQIKQCFQSILTTGQGSAGLCRATLTTYLCDIIFDAISCFSQLFGAGTGGRTEEPKTRGITGFMRAMSDAGDDIQKSITERYGKTGLFEAMFTERKLVHSMCLFAFTGDWDLDLDQAMGGLSVVPLKSEGFVYPATRRYITSNPLQYGRTTYIYHIGAGLVAGDDVNYRLQLICSADNSCDKDDDFPNGECDCFRKGPVPPLDITREFGPGRTSAGSVVQADIYANVPDSPVRYDKVRLTWNSVKNVAGKEAPSGEVIYPIKREGGRAPADCTFDVGSLEFRCRFDIGERGYATFLQPPISANAVSPTGAPLPAGIGRSFGLGEPLRLYMAVSKKSPNFEPQSSDLNKRNPANELPFYLRYQIRTPRDFITSGSRDVPSSGMFYFPIAYDGTVELRDRPGIIITKEHFTGGETSTEGIVRIRPLTDIEPGIAQFLPGEFRATARITTTTYTAIKFDQSVATPGDKINYQIFDVDMSAKPPKQQLIQSGTYDTAANLPIMVASRSFSIKPQGSANDLKGRGILVVAEPSPTRGATPVDACTAAASTPETWNVHVDLVYPKPKGNVPLTAQTAEPSNEVVVYNGQEQSYDVPVQVVCNDVSGGRAAQQCAVDKKLTSLCRCGTLEETAPSGEPFPKFCGDLTAGYGDYCKLNYPFGTECLTYKTCSVKNKFPTSGSTASLRPVTELCDCDGDIDNSMECPEEAYCTEISANAGAYKCSSPITVARTTRTSP